MLAWISRLFGKKADRSAGIQAISQQILPFLSSAKMQVDQRDLMTPNKHILIYCFAFGCIDAVDHGLDETARLAVLLQLMKMTSQNTDARDISAMLDRCRQLLLEKEGARARATGEQCFQLWNAGERQASQVLSKYLASLQESPAIPDGL